MPSTSLRHVAVTGSIGAGKSAVIAALKELLPSWGFFSVDEAVAQCYALPEVQARLNAAFGTCDKRELSKRAFSDPSFRTELELFFQQQTPLGSLIDQFQEAHSHCVVEFPTLFEKPQWVNRFDFVIALVAPTEVRKARFLKRPGARLEIFEGVEAAQLTGPVKSALATCALDTSTFPLAELREILQAQLLPRLDEPLFKTTLKIADRPLSPARFSKELNQFFTQTVGVGIELESLERAYRQSHRVYHGVSHLEHLYANLQKAQALGFCEDVDIRALGWALLYHDCVYELSSLSLYKHNEAESLKTFHSMMRQAEHQTPAYQESILTACELIMATQLHRIEDNAYLNASSRRRATAELFLDLDLSILASPWNEFLRYDDEITQEWAQCGDVGPLQFKLGRAQVLESFGNRPRLFYSPFGQTLEPLARQNIARLLAERYGQV